MNCLRTRASTRHLLVCLSHSAISVTGYLHTLEKGNTLEGLESRVLTVHCTSSRVVLVCIRDESVGQSLLINLLRLRKKREAILIQVFDNSRKRSSRFRNKVGQREREYTESALIPLQERAWKRRTRRIGGRASAGQLFVRIDRAPPRHSAAATAAAAERRASVASDPRAHPDFRLPNGAKSAPFVLISSRLALYLIQQRVNRP